MRREVSKEMEEKRGRGEGKPDVMCFSAAWVSGTIWGRERSPVVRMAAPQARKGRRKPLNCDSLTLIPTQGRAGYILANPRSEGWRYRRC